MALHACAEAREQLVEPASNTRRCRLRPAGSPEASLSAGSHLRLLQAPASLGQSAARAALAGHTGLGFDRGRRASVPYSAWRPGSKLPCASGMHSTQEAGACSLCVQYGGPIMDVRVSTSGGPRHRLSALERVWWQVAIGGDVRTTHWRCEPAGRQVLHAVVVDLWRRRSHLGVGVAPATTRAAVGQSRSLPNQVGGVA